MPVRERLGQPSMGRLAHDWSDESEGLGGSEVVTQSGKAKIDRAGTCCSLMGG